MEERSTKVSGILEMLRENPKASNEEIGEYISASDSVVRTMLSRLKRKGLVEDIGANGIREFRVMQTQTEERYDYKKEMLTNMCDAYYEDFINAELYSERVEIGKMICRILEKL